MNQEKIGKFICKLRKEKRMTQQGLADKLGVTYRAISNWENGRRLPDYTLIKMLCNELGITINDLLSGEKLSEEKYQEKLEENIINLSIDNKKMLSKKAKTIFLSCLVITSMFIGLLIYNFYELDVTYEKRTMKCHFQNNTLTYTIIGTSLLNTDYIERTINGEKYMVFHSTTNIYNKQHSNWEYGESLARIINDEEIPFGFQWTFDQEENKKISVYYTNKSLNKIKNLNDKDFLKEIKKSIKMCNNEEPK